MNKKIKPLTRFTQLFFGLGSMLVGLSYAAVPNLPAPPNTQQVFFVGNNWDGTVTVIRPSGDFGKVGVINMIPDRKERLLEIHLNPIKLIAYTYIQATAGEGLGRDFRRGRH